MYKLKVSKADQKYYGDEPVWVDGYTPDDYTSEMTKSLNWYNDIASFKDCRAFLKDWFASDKKMLSNLSSIPDRLIPTTYANIARMAVRGFPVTDAHKDKITEAVNSRVVNKADSEDVVVRAKPRLKPLATAHIIAEMNDEIENLLNGEEPTKLDVILDRYRVSGAQYTECADKVDIIAYEFNQLLVARRKKKSSLTDDEEQLLEGYSNIKNLTEIKNIVRMLEAYSVGIRKKFTEKQKVKIRKKRPKDIAKMVKNIKYQAKDPDLGLTSLEPTNLLNCSEVWTYDTKTKRISRYVTSISGSITVKGASIVEYKEESSSSRLLRKPDIQLKEFQECAKKDLTSWYSAIKSKPTSVKKRTTDTTIILKVFR